MKDNYAMAETVALRVLFSANFVLLRQGTASAVASAVAIKNSSGRGPTTWMAAAVVVVAAQDAMFSLLGNYRTQFIYLHVNYSFASTF